MKRICCICKKEIKDYGNNPSPIEHEKDEVCCNDCNFNVIIPLRLLLKKKREGK